VVVLSKAEVLFGSTRRAVEGSGPPGARAGALGVLVAIRCGRLPAPALHQLSSRISGWTSASRTVHHFRQGRVCLRALFDSLRSYARAQSRLVN
jgi:hypothetical protein